MGAQRMPALPAVDRAARAVQIAEIDHLAVGSGRKRDSERLQRVVRVLEDRISIARYAVRPPREQLVERLHAQGMVETDLMQIAPAPTVAIRAQPLRQEC